MLNRAQGLRPLAAAILLLSLAILLVSFGTGCAHAIIPGEEEDYVIPLPEPGNSVAFALISATPRFAPQQIFVNLDGATITPSGWSDDNARTNTSFIPEAAAVLPAFDHTPWGADRAAVVQALLAGLEEDFAGFQVTFTTTRPASGDYTMVVVGGHPEDAGRGGLGVAPLDDGNRNPNDVAFVFSALAGDVGYTLRGLAWTISHELGHSLGLRHVEPEADIMAPVACHCVRGWGSGPVVGGGAGAFQDDLATLALVLPTAGTPEPSAPAPVASTAPVVGIAAASSGDGIWLARSDGAVDAFGSSQHHGDAVGASAPVVGIVGSPDGAGYWLVGSDGSVHALGSAPYHGSAAGLGLAAPFVAMAATRDAGGYWLAAADGTVLAFGNATFHGAPAAPPAGGVSSMAATSDDGGYWLLTSAGEVLAFGNAPFFGSVSSDPPDPVVALTPRPDDTGYWVFGHFTMRSFGSAGLLPTLQPLVVTAPLVDGASNSAGDGYWIVSGNGEVIAFGAAPYLGP